MVLVRVGRKSPVQDYRVSIYSSWLGVFRDLDLPPERAGSVQGAKNFKCCAGILWRSIDKSENNSLRFIDDFDRRYGCIIYDRLERQIEFPFLVRAKVIKRLGQRV